MAPAVFVLALLGGWELLVRLGAIDPLLVPAPSQVAQSLWEDRAVLAPDLLVTSWEVLLGLAGALVLGAALALAMHLSSTVERTLRPLVIGSQAVPMPVIAPVVVLILGFGIGPKILMVALVCFFPVTINLYDGLRDVDPDALKLLRSLDASRWQSLRFLEAPAALPAAFTGVKVAAAVAVIGAVFGEWSGSDSGLGHTLLTANGQLETPRAFAATALLFAMAIVLYAAFAALERRVISWTPRARGRRGVVVAAALLLALVLAGCGEKREPTGPGKREPFTLMLDYFPNADHAGIYAAQAAGLYAKAGLNVKIETPPDPSAPLKLLRAGRADVAISYEPELLLARDHGADNLVSAGALVQVPLTSLMALGSAHIASPRDLAGKRVGTSGISYQHAYLQTILRRAGVDPARVKETNVGFNLVPAMLSKKADATLGAFWNYEGVDLERRHRRPVILRMEKLGVPTYNELILVVRSGDLNEAGASRLRRFLQATADGYRLLKRDPSIGVDALVKASHGLDAGLQEASVRATMPAFFPKDKSLPWGWQEPTEWAAYERWMRANRLLTRPPADVPPLTNEFLPGQTSR